MIIFEPVRIGQIWQYDSTYTRQGRFRILAHIASVDLWTVEEIENHGPGVQRHYKEKNVHDISFLTMVQIDQRWMDSAGHLLRVIDIKKGVGHLVPWFVKFEDEGNPQIGIQVMGEDLFTGYTLVQGVSPPKKAPAKDNCPLCGSSGISGFNMFDCSSSKRLCRNGR